MAVLEALIGKILAEAAKPFAERARQELAKRGLGRVDVMEGLRQAGLKTGKAVTLGLLAQLPDGVTDRQVQDRVIASSDFTALSRNLIAVHLAGGSAQARARIQDGLATVVIRAFPDAAEPELRGYSGHLFVVMDELCASASSNVRRYAAGKDNAHEWAYSAMAVAALESIERHVQLLAESPSAAHDGWLSRYREQFFEVHAKIELPDLRNRETFPYRDIHVPASFSPESPAANRTSPPPARQTVGFADILDATDRAVLLGDPGAGKSTSSLVAALNCAAEADLVPYFIALKHTTVQGDGFSVVGHLEDQLRELYQCAAPAGAVEQTLLTGQAFLVFDGLDELLNPALRRSVSRTIEAACRAYPYTTVVVTSRRIGYSVARLDPAVFAAFAIEPFDTAQVAEYVRKWFRAKLPRSSDSDITGLTAGFLAESGAITDLRSNPLLLALICILYQGSGYLPHSRPELYERCSELLLGGWDYYRRITGTTPKIDRLRVALSRIGYESMAGHRVAAGFKEPEVHSLVVEQLMNESVYSVREANDIADQLIHLCRGRAWIFTDTGLDERHDEIFDFTHTSFREYFTALYVTRRARTEDDLAEALIGPLSEGRWELVGHICLTLRDRLADAGSSRAFAAIAERSRTVDQPSAVVEFLLRTSSWLDLNADALEALLVRLVLSAVRGDESGLAEVFRADYGPREAVRGLLPRILSEVRLADELGVPRLTCAALVLGLPTLGSLVPEGELDPETLTSVRRRTDRGPWIQVLDAAEDSPYLHFLRLISGTWTLGQYHATKLAGSAPWSLSLTIASLFDYRGGLPSGSWSVAEWILEGLAGEVRGLYPMPAVTALARDLGALCGDNLASATLPAPGTSEEPGRTDAVMQEQATFDQLWTALLRCAGYDEDVRFGVLFIAMARTEVLLAGYLSPESLRAETGWARQLAAHGPVPLRPERAAFYRSWVEGATDIWTWRLGEAS